VLFFQDLGGYPLCDPDEARHAEVAREMATARGVRRLFLPTLEFEPYREKPAAYYWLVTLAYGVLGVGERGARAVGAAAALAVVLGVYAFALPRTGPAGALAAGLVLATSVGWLALARYATLDMTLTACVAAGVLAGLAWLERPAPRRPPLVPYAAAALGTLVKGPLAAALVAGPLLLVALTRRPRPALDEIGLGRGLAVAAVLVAALWAPIALLDPSYLAAFVGTNLRRFGSESPHAAPVWYYLVWLPALALPWTLLVGPALVRAARDPERRPLVLWAGFVPALLTLPRGKLATYGLSVLVPLALLGGPPLAHAVLAGPEPEDRRMFRLAGWLAVAVLLVAAVAAPLVTLLYPVPAWGRVLLALLALAWAGALVVALRRDLPGLVPAVILGACLTMYPVGVRAVVPAVAALHSDRAAAEIILAASPGATPAVVAFAARAPSLVFYLRGPVIRTDDLALVRDLFAREPPVFLVTGRGHFAEVERALGPLAHRWYGNARRALYANRPAP
jgi:4-amino-4-deoxy-L-arabinose transferase-like glycosyltransferase